MATGGHGRERMGPEGDSGEDSDNKNTVTTVRRF
jgi:hypothetical protein